MMSGEYELCGRREEEVDERESSEGKQKEMCRQNALALYCAICRTCKGQLRIGL